MCRAITAIGLAVLLSTGVLAGKEPVHKILWGYPTRRDHDQTDHTQQGRIIGTVLRCPGCTIEILNTSQGVLQCVELKLGEPTYASQWLEPDEYTLRVSADGWPMAVLPGIKVEAGCDTSMPLGFLEKEPKPERSDGLSIPDDIEVLPEWRPPYVPQAPMRHFRPGYPVPKEVVPGEQANNDNREKSNKGKGGGGKKGQKNRGKNRKNKGIKILGGK